MAIERTASATTSDCEVVFRRTFDAQRDLVFRAWTEPERLMQWWGPRTWPLSRCTIDLRPGGAWHYCMRGPNGEEAWGRALYESVSRPERLVYQDAFSDAQGTMVPPISLTTVTFDDDQGKTQLTLVAVFETPEHCARVVKMGMQEGMEETLDRLEEHLAAH